MAIPQRPSLLTPRLILMYCDTVVEGSPAFPVKTPLEYIWKENPPASMATDTGWLATAPAMVAVGLDDFPASQVPSSSL
ncbi:unnamed protein product [Spirodela intermedia]|uniref:Uncharacterized protein n=1 Tax=Spirodela intermedia TaxID=51605 RepID=A0A7I8J6X4_SPIIN|nr:unnamed protein product [Spirodela intermedia]CAA6665804.1 unnamed protein product [Spirodela intermedia]